MERLLRLLLGLALTLCSSRADYPPHDVNYRVHYHDLYPKEAPHSTMCVGRNNGAYPHHNLDFGDPRCTFVVCSNARPIIQSCPRGTRTMYDIRPSTLNHALLARLHRHGYHDTVLHGASFSNRNAGDAHDAATKPAGAKADAINNNQIEADVGGQPKDAYHGYNVHVYSPLYFNHKMCNVHDVHGVCGDPFPDLNAYGNEVPKTDTVHGV